MIIYDVNLEELFPNNELIKNVQSIVFVYPSWVCFSQLICCVYCLTFRVQHLVMLGGIFFGTIRYFGILNIDKFMFFCH